LVEDIGRGLRDRERQVAELIDELLRHEDIGEVLLDEVLWDRLQKERFGFFCAHQVDAQAVAGGGDGALKAAIASCNEDTAAARDVLTDADAVVLIGCPHELIQVVGVVENEEPVP